MRIYYHKLSQTLQQQLTPLWLIFGDEIWQKNQSLETVKQVAQSQGYSELIRFTCDEKFNWQTVIDEFQTLSLFADKRIIEIEVVKGKFNEQAGKVMLQLFELWNNQVENDVLLILHGPKLDAATTRKKWFKTFDKKMTYLPLYELEDRALSGWINQQARHYQLQLDHQSTALLADYYEGNLPTLDQELQKLSILYPQARITADELNTLLNQQAKFNHFQLVDTLLKGDLAKALLMLKQLQQEGMAVAQIIWVLHKECKQLLAMHEQIKQGEKTQQVFSNFRVWEKKKPLYQSALANISVGNLKTALSRLASTDLISKTVTEFDPYILLTDICTSLYFGETTEHLSLNYH